LKSFVSTEAGLAATIGFIPVGRSVVRYFS